MSPGCFDNAEIHQRQIIYSSFVYGILNMFDKTKLTVTKTCFMICDVSSQHLREELESVLFTNGIRFQSGGR